jgi:hypothetical protein
VPVAKTKSFGRSGDAIQIGTIDSDINVSRYTRCIMVSRADLEEYGQSSDHTIFDSRTR